MQEYDGEIVEQEAHGADERMEAGEGAMRDRERVEAAEAKVKELTTQVQTMEKESRQKQASLEQLERQQRLTKALMREGVVDLEVGLLIAESRLKEKPDAGDEQTVAAELRRERPGLFGETMGGGSETRSAGVRVPSNGRRCLERLAGRAAQSGNRRDIQEYLRQRRGWR